MSQEDVCIRTLLIIAVLLLCFPVVFAYIDPGSGGMVVSSVGNMIVGFFALVAAFVLLRFIKPLKNHIRRIGR